MRIFLLVFHIIIALFLIGVVLLQPGEDAAGSSKTMTGQANLLTKMTGILGGIFFMTSLFMAILIRKEASLMTPSAPIKKELRVSQEPESEKDQTKTKIKTQPVSAEADEKPIASVKEMAEPKASVQSHGESTSA